MLPLSRTFQCSWGWLPSGMSASWAMLPEPSCPTHKPSPSWLPTFSRYSKTAPALAYPKHFFAKWHTVQAVLSSSYKLLWSGAVGGVVLLWSSTKWPSNYSCFAAEVDKRYPPPGTPDQTCQNLGYALLMCAAQVSKGCETWGVLRLPCV